MIQLKQIIFLSVVGWLYSHEITYSLGSNSYCTLEQKNKMFGRKVTVVTLYTDTEAVGYLHYIWLPFNTVVIYNFFIEHPYRHQGYGSLLLRFICDDLYTQHVKRIIVQPGPFDYEQNMYQSFTAEEYQQRLQSLVQFYTKLGFTQAPGWMRLGAKLLYPLLGIHENPSYLLMK